MLGSSSQLKYLKYSTDSVDTAAWLRHCKETEACGDSFNTPKTLQLWEQQDTAALQLGRHCSYSQCWQTWSWEVSITSGSQA